MRKLVWLVLGALVVWLGYRFVLGRSPTEGAGGVTAGTERLMKDLKGLQKTYQQRKKSGQGAEGPPLDPLSAQPSAISDDQAAAGEKAMEALDKIRPMPSETEAR